MRQRHELANLKGTKSLSAQQNDIMFEMYKAGELQTAIL